MKVDAEALEVSGLETQRCWKQRWRGLEGSPGIHSGPCHKDRKHPVSSV